MDKTSLGDRMKRYEEVSERFLVSKIPVIGRVDGRAFHTLTNGMVKPWDERFVNTMLDVAHSLCAQIQGCNLAHVASDEVSLLLTDFEKPTTEGWFGYRLNKMVAIAAAIATDKFAVNKVFHFGSRGLLDPALFDARFFNLPADEVCNYFIWRQQDAVRNSISALAQSKFSHNELWGKKSNQMQEMLWSQHKINWDNTPTHLKRGACVTRKDSRWQSDLEPPLFTADRSYVEQWLK